MRVVMPNSRNVEKIAADFVKYRRDMGEQPKKIGDIWWIVLCFDGEEAFWNNDRVLKINVDVNGRPKRIPEADIIIVNNEVTPLLTWAMAAIALNHPCAAMYYMKPDGRVSELVSLSNQRKCPHYACPVCAAERASV